MGSTTGGLWASADGGDAWFTVSLHLPPIFAIRWAEASGSVARRCAAL